MNTHLLTEVSSLILELVDFARTKSSPESILAERPVSITVQKLFRLEETIRSLRALVLQKEGDGKNEEACPLCDKKILHLKQHLQTSLHSCDACNYVSIYDIDAHQSICFKSLREKENNAAKCGLTYIHSEGKAFTVRADKTVYDDKGVYTGRLCEDGSLDKTVKEKAPVSCAHCDKKFLNMKLHIKNSHTCDYCETEVADKYKHYDTCNQMIEQLTDMAKERGLTYVHSELSDYKVVAGNYYEWDDKTNTVGAFVGRRRGDGTLDKAAVESFGPGPASGPSPEPCPYCDKKLLNLKTHIKNIHTCSRCEDATIRNMEAHYSVCKPRPQFREYINTAKPDSKITCPYCAMKFTELSGHIAIAHTCPTCKGGIFKDLTGHMSTCGQIQEAKKKKERIPAHIKTIVWRTYIGNEKPEAKCYCCRHETIDIRNFECGHVVAEAKGGPLTVDNLRPICRGCNGAMGTVSMEEYCQKFFGRSVSVVTSTEKENKEDYDVFGLFTAAPVEKHTVDPFADANADLLDVIS